MKFRIALYNGKNVFLDTEGLKEEDAFQLARQLSIASMVCRIDGPQDGEVTHVFRHGAREVKP